MGRTVFSETESILLNESVSRIDLVLSSSGGGGVSSSSRAACVLKAAEGRSSSQQHAERSPSADKCAEKTLFWPPVSRIEKSRSPDL
ncbi:hypothetical protein MHYP_G00160200 [Metynnis hypsauchen]